MKTSGKLKEKGKDLREVIFCVLVSERWPIWRKTTHGVKSQTA
jgi:hypothetical protein